MEGVGPLPVPGRPRGWGVTLPAGPPGWGCSLDGRVYQMLSPLPQGDGTGVRPWRGDGVVRVEPLGWEQCSQRQPRGPSAPLHGRTQGEGTSVDQGAGVTGRVCWGPGLRAVGHKGVAFCHSGRRGLRLLVGITALCEPGEAGLSTAALLGDEGPSWVGSCPS